MRKYLKFLMKIKCLFQQYEIYPSFPGLVAKTLSNPYRNSRSSSMDGKGMSVKSAEYLKIIQSVRMVTLMLVTDVRDQIRW